MKHRSKSVALALSGISFLFFCLLQNPATWAMRLSRVYRQPERQKGETPRGEWLVRCSVRSYRAREPQSKVLDERESLIVIESDPDGSYELLKFPDGLGEGLPRLRKITDNQFSGDDTIRGITTVVQQTVDLIGRTIRVRQSVIDASSKQPLTETECTGSRPNSTVALNSAINIAPCKADNRSGDPPNRKLLRMYKSVKPFYEGLAAAAVIPRGSHTLKWGFIDNKGEVVIPMRYDVVTSFYDGLAAVGRAYGRGRNIKWGVVERLGPQVTPHVNYDAVKILGDGFAAVGYTVPGQRGLKWNLINRENTIIRYGFDEIGCFTGGRASASYSEGDVVHSGYINKIGDFFVESK